MNKNQQFGLIFDMDGVLVDSEPLHAQAEDVMFARLGIAPSAELRHGFVGLSVPLMWERLRNEFRLEAMVEDLVAFDKRSRLEYFASIESMTPIRGIPELLDSLDAVGWKIGLASSSCNELIEIFMERLKFKERIPLRVSGDEVARGKPYPDVFLETARRIGGAARRYAVIEDSRNGVLAAKAAGMVCVGYRNPQSGNQDLSAADVVVDDLREVDARFLETLF